MPANQLIAHTEVDPLADDERWLAIRHAIASPLLNKSPRLCALFSYLAEHTLAPRTDLLTEYNIATSVFQRQADFDADVDTIVRSHMVRLRQKLEQYAAENPANGFPRFTVPRGEYRVRFEQVVASKPQTSESLLPSPVEVPQTASPRNHRRSPLVWLCGALCLVAILLLALLVRAQSRVAAAAVPDHPLWNHLFLPHQSTTLVAADSGLVLLHRMTGKPTTLKEYLTRDFSQETRGLSAARTDEVLNLADRRYTSFVDLNIYRHLQQLAATTSGKLDVRYARDMQLDELKQGNVILSGSRGANPWLALYEPKMNFIGDDGWNHHSFTFLNRRPQAGEAAAYSTSEDDPAQRVLGVLAYLPNLNGSGHTLIIEGNSMAGTEAISDFLFDDAALLPFLVKLKRPDGAIPFFEVLIEANSVNGSAGPFRILAYRTHS